MILSPSSSRPSEIVGSFSTHSRNFLCALSLLLVSPPFSFGPRHFPFPSHHFQTSSKLFISKSSAKFWEINQTGKKVTIRFGKIGVAGQTTIKYFDSPAEAKTHADKVKAEKKKKGYTEQLEAAPSPSKKPRNTQKNSVSKGVAGNPAKKSKQKKDNETLVFANMEGFDTAEQPAGFSSLPSEFKTAHDLWTKDATKNMGKIIKLLSPYIIAQFLPDAIGGWKALFRDPDGNGFPGFDAISICVTDIDFSYNTPIPACTAEALFRVPVTKAFTRCDDLDAWQEENDYFYGGVSFGWKVPRTKATKDMDFMWENHSGCACLVGYDPTPQGWPHIDDIG